MATERLTGPEELWMWVQKAPHLPACSFHLGEGCDCGRNAALDRLDDPPSPVPGPEPEGRQAEEVRMWDDSDATRAWAAMVREDAQCFDPTPGSSEYAVLCHLFTALDTIDAALAPPRAEELAPEEGVVWWEGARFRLEWAGHTSADGSDLRPIGALTVMGPNDTTAHVHWQRLYRLVPAAPRDPEEQHGEYTVAPTTFIDLEREEDDG